MSFVENKHPNAARIAGLLERSALANFWANRGPVYQRLAQSYADYIHRPRGTAIVPLANGGIALEAMARRHAVKAGRRLRWVASAYSFQNLGRGYFADVHFLDCDSQGLLDIEALNALDPDSYDGIILTNPFGLFAASLTPYANFANALGKALIVDNASGLHSQIANIRWQALSLHHTKPFGMGEGGLALVPENEAEALYDLVNYTPETAMPGHWLQNGKLSDISAAYLLDRLEQLVDWGPRYLAQRQRVIDIAADCGLTPLAMPETDIPMTSMPFLAPSPVPLEAIERTRHLTYAKYYRPLAGLPEVTRLFAHLVNIPCHGDVAKLSDDQIAGDMLICTERRIQAVAS
ncbi:MAG: hypothetical protein HKO14_09320 [Silicimonas sp.]|nr:hypothetical protein [Silicimonas sp.]